MQRILVVLVVFAAVLARGLAFAQPLTTAFTFQGQLTSGGSPAAGLFDLRFRLYDALLGGNQIGATQCADNVSVAAGLVTVQLDFGAQFAGQQRFVEVDVRQDAGLDCTSSAGFTTLGPRQALTAAPNADFALTAASASNALSLNGQAAGFYTNAGNLSAGTIANARTTGASTNTASSLVLRDASGGFSAGAVTASSFSGGGAGLTGLTASNINAGTLGDSFLSSNIPRLNSVNAFSAANNSFSGSVGVGAASPLSRLHVATGTSGATPNGSSVATIERNGTVYLSLLSPATSERGILFGDTGNSADGSIIYNNTNTSRGLQFRTGGNVTRVAIDSAGQVGIGTLAPAAKLDIAGTAGTDGIRFPDGTVQTTAFRGIKASVAFDPPSMSAGTCVDVTLAVPGATAGDVAIVNVANPMTCGLLIQSTRVATDQVIIRLTNPTTITIDGGPNTAIVLVLK